MDQFDLKENIIVQLGLQALPEAERLEFLEKMTDIVIKRVMLRLMENLPEEDVAEANGLADAPDELIAFLAGKVDDVALIFEEETEATKKEMAAAAELPKE